MRKRDYQGELEDKIEILEKVQKEIKQANVDLVTSNTLLKKRLAYFEDAFTKTSLVGFESSDGESNKNDFEEFRNELLRKINKKFN